MSGPCPGCQLDRAALTPLDAVRWVRTLPHRYRRAFGNPVAADSRPDDPDSPLRARPRPEVWSPVEYLGHAVDMLDIIAPAIRRCVVEDDPELWIFDPEEQAEEQDYNGVPLAELISRLETACADLSLTIDDIDPEEWQRQGRLDDHRVSALDLLRRAIHEGIHHLADIEAAMDDLAGTQRPATEAPVET